MQVCRKNVPTVSFGNFGVSRWCPESEKYVSERRQRLNKGAIFR
jgi:hypothetical protein